MVWRILIGFSFCAILCCGIKCHKVCNYTCPSRSSLLLQGQWLHYRCQPLSPLEKRKEGGGGEWSESFTPFHSQIPLQVTSWLFFFTNFSGLTLSPQSQLKTIMFTSQPTSFWLLRLSFQQLFLWWQLTSMTLIPTSTLNLILVVSGALDIHFSFQGTQRSLLLFHNEWCSRFSNASLPASFPLLKEQHN